MRLRDLKGKVWSALVALVVIAAITLLGLLMVPKQGAKFGLKGVSICEAGDLPCACPTGYDDYDKDHPKGKCTKNGTECKTEKKCWYHYPWAGFDWVSAPCGGFWEKEQYK